MFPWNSKILSMRAFRIAPAQKSYLILLDWVGRSISVWYRLLVSRKPVPGHILSFRPNLTTRIDLMCIWAMTYCSMHHCRYFYPCYLLATVPFRIEPGDRLYFRAEDGLVHAISVLIFSTGRLLGYQFSQIFLINKVNLLASLMGPTLIILELLLDKWMDTQVSLANKSSIASYTRLWCCTCCLFSHSFRNSWKNNSRKGKVNTLAITPNLAPENIPTYIWKAWFFWFLEKQQKVAAERLIKQSWSKDAEKEGIKRKLLRRRKKIKRILKLSLL